MQRRQFITILGGTAVAGPLLAHAQQGRVRRIGWLSSAAETPGAAQSRLDAFKRGLADFGWVEGRTVTFDQRWANDDTTRLPSLAAELVASRPDLIFVANSPTLAAVRRATGSIPIVF